MAKTNKHNLYTGRSGQLAVMAVLLQRGYNVAIPEVDVGDDIFVVRDADGKLTRVQVKASMARGRTRYSGNFHIPLAQLREAHDPDLVFVFAIHYEGYWREFVVIESRELYGLRVSLGIGRLDQGGTRLSLRLSFGPTDVTCGGVNLQPYRNNWDRWPPIDH
jgi:hypothetical protein